MSKIKFEQLGNKKAKCVSAMFSGKDWSNPSNPKIKVYYHEIKFDDGTKGIYGSKSKEQTTFIEGNTYEFSVEKKSWIDSGDFIENIIKPIKNDFTGKDPGRKKDFMSYYEKPENIYKNARFKAIHNAVVYCSKLRTKLLTNNNTAKIPYTEITENLIMKFANTFMKLFYKDMTINEPNKDEIEIRQQAMYLAIQYMDDDYTAIYSTEDFLVCYNMFIDIIKNTGINE